MKQTRGIECGVVKGLNELQPMIWRALGLIAMDLMQGRTEQYGE